MKTIELEITKTQETKEKVTLTIPCYWKTGANYCALTDPNRGVIIRTSAQYEEVSAFVYPQVYFSCASEFITKEEFNEQFNKVINHLKQII